MSKPQFNEMKVSASVLELLHVVERSFHGATMGHRRKSECNKRALGSALALGLVEMAEGTIVNDVPTGTIVHCTSKGRAVVELARRYFSTPDLRW